MRYKITPPNLLKVREKPFNDQPREKLIKYGVISLTDEELVSLLLNSGSANIPIDKLSDSVIKVLDKKEYFNINELSKIKGLGIVKSSQICAAMELGRRKIPKIRQQIIDPKDVFRAVRHYASRRQEMFISIAINCAHEILSIDIASMGTINQCIVHPREVFSNAIDHRAVAIIICHNHPTGNLSPSSNDLHITQRLVECGKLLGIEILDHIIFSEEEYHSMKEYNEL